MDVGQGQGRVHRTRRLLPVHPPSEGRAHPGAAAGPEQLVRHGQRHADGARRGQLVGPVRVHDGAVAVRQHQRVARGAQLALLAAQLGLVRVVRVDVLDGHAALLRVERLAAPLCPVHGGALVLCEHRERLARPLVLQLVSDGDIHALLPERVQRGGALTLALFVRLKGSGRDLFKKGAAPI